MKIHLVRHAPAIEPRGNSYLNDDRPLSEEGIKRMKKGARGIHKLISKPELIISSPLIRAHDTASIIAKEFGCKNRVIVVDSLSPGTNPTKILAGIRKYLPAKELVIVGHEPDLSAFASLLVGSLTTVVDMKKGSIISLDVDGSLGAKPGIIKFLVHLDELEELGKETEHKKKKPKKAKKKRKARKKK